MSKVELAILAEIGKIPLEDWCRKEKDTGAFLAKYNNFTFRLTSISVDIDAYGSTDVKATIGHVSICNKMYSLVTSYWNNEKEKEQEKTLNTILTRLKDE